jgi:serine protease
MKSATRRRRALLGIASLFASTLPLAAHAGGPDVTPTAAAARAAVLGAGATNRLIVKYRSAAAAVAPDAGTMSSAQGAANRLGAQLQHLRRTAQGAHVLKLDRFMALDQVRAMARELMSTDANVEYAEPDQLLQPQLTPNDSRYLDQWNYYEATGGINLPPAWDKSTGTGVVVAVIDTGYRPHADLAANILPGYDMINDTAVANDGNLRDGDASDPGDWVAANECAAGDPAQDSSWHGTHVAGTVAAVTNNGSGVAGVAFGAKVVPVRVLGKCGGYTSDIADGIVWASGGAVAGVAANANPARVINMSLGGGGACGTTTQNAINGARSRGTVVVVAAGNSNLNASNFNPANCAGVIAVASTTRSGGKSSFSNFGTAVDVAAPGSGILSTLNSGTTTPGADTLASYSGTSMAAPHVAGVVALMLARNSALTPDEVETRLKGSTRAFPATCSGCGTGIVDANAAVDAAAGTTPPPPPPPPPPPSGTTARCRPPRSSASIRPRSTAR